MRPAPAQVIDLGETLLAATTEIGNDQVDLMSHTLGWPSLATMAAGKAGRVRWRSPYRNGYSADPGSKASRAWRGLALEGLAVGPRTCDLHPYEGWSVTPKGIAVTRLCLMATLLARGLK